MAKQTIRLAMKSLLAARKLAKAVRGKNQYTNEHNNTYSCPAPAVMAARIETSAPETTAAGYPKTLTITCRLPKRK